MIGSIDLDGGANLGLVADVDRGNVEKDAVEVEEDAPANADVVTVVAEEGRADDGTLTTGGKEVGKESCVRKRVMRRVVVLTEEGGGVAAVGVEDGIIGVVELAG